MSGGCDQHNVSDYECQACSMFDNVRSHLVREIVANVRLQEWGDGQEQLAADYVERKWGEKR